MAITQTNQPSVARHALVVVVMTAVLTLAWMLAPIFGLCAAAGAFASDSKALTSTLPKRLALHAGLVAIVGAAGFALGTVAFSIATLVVGIVCLLAAHPEI